MSKNSSPSPPLLPLLLFSPSSSEGCGSPLQPLAGWVSPGSPVGLGCRQRCAVDPGCRRCARGSVQVPARQCRGLAPALPASREAGGKQELLKDLMVPQYVCERGEGTRGWGRCSARGSAPCTAIFGVHLCPLHLGPPRGCTAVGRDVCSGMVCSQGSGGVTVWGSVTGARGHMPPRRASLAQAISGLLPTGAMGGRGELPKRHRLCQNTSTAGKCWEPSWVFDEYPLLGLLDARSGFVLLARSLKFQ